MSENEYSSEQFAEFSNQYGFLHITSSPKYPQSNGVAERAVRTIKDILKWNKIQNGEMYSQYIAMLAYRSTLRTIHNCSGEKTNKERELQQTSPSSDFEASQKGR